MNILLVGDSVIDNSPYVGEENCVTTRLKEKFPDANIVNAAVDGYTTKDVLRALKKKGLPAGYDYVILSIGGNDLLQNADVFSIPGVSSEKKVLMSQATAKHDRIGRVLSLYNGKVFVLNLYFPFLDESEFGHTFITEARRTRDRFNSFLDTNYSYEQVIKLDSLLTEKEDFVYTIEPSEKASLKIANKIFETINGEKIKNSGNEQEVLCH